MIDYRYCSIPYIDSMPNGHIVRFVAMRHFAGVRWNRVAYFDTFGDANRAAIEACGRLQVPVRVFSLRREAEKIFYGLLAEYQPGQSGQPLCIPQ